MPIRKDIDPRGFILNDNDTGVDHLGESTFADAIAESLHHVETPITIGLYAKWGSGKSFLLKHIQNILKRFQKQQEILDKKKKGKPDQKLRWKHACRAFMWTVVVVVIFFILLLTFMLAVKPSLITNCFGMDMPDANDDDMADDEDEVTDSPGEIEKPKSALRKFKIAGLILLPIELLMVFVIGCFGNNWLSHGYYGSCKLLAYGAFTKLPLKGDDDVIVEDPGESTAKVLKYVPRGDERLAIAVSDVPIYPRKYIFVNFKAWEYAGSDTLWAAIVTKITDAIEQEFGTITARMFRMLKVEKIDKSICSNAARTIYVKMMETSHVDDVRDMMQQYGVVKICDKSGNAFWKVVYHSDAGCRNAKDCLRIEGVTFQVTDPLKDYVEDEITTGPSRNQPSRESRQELMAKRDFGKRRPTNDCTDLTRWSSPSKESCCHRFCCHFVKYPIKILCLPRLIWWILILSCAVLTPIIAYVIAEYFELDIYRTYRAIPVYGQLLLWLPAGAAVSALAAKFVWAMCHSQRKRINTALDGARNNMAEQLGFMSKVKSEIAVVTKLIHCARFTHQKDYKIVITIDDLDRIQMHKIQSVLEALNVLLSDVSAPFICLVAVDSRVAVKCIEEKMGDVLKESRITGQEYLKKIINLPICLPEISDSNKKRFLAGLIDQADHAVNYRVINEQSKMMTAESSHRWALHISGGATDSAIHEVRSPTESVSSSTFREDEIDALPTDDEADTLPEDVSPASKTIPTTDANGNIPQTAFVDSVAKSASSKKIKPSRSYDNTRASSFKTTSFITAKADVHYHNASLTRDANRNIVGTATVDSGACTSATCYKRLPRVPDEHCSSHASGYKTTDIVSECRNVMPFPTRLTNGTATMHRYDSEKRETQPREMGNKYNEIELTHEKFLFECRLYIYNNAELHKHIHGNPRNIKRIFNIVSLTASLINSALRKKQRRVFIMSHSGGENSPCDSLDTTKRTGKLAADIVRWVILTDQWPYRTSYILQVIEDAFQRCNAGIDKERIPDDWTIFEIYENRVKEECLKGKAWLSLDGDPDLFFSYLLLLKDGGFTTQKILSLQNYIVNLDHSIRHAISFERDISALTLSKRLNTSTEKCATPSDELDMPARNSTPEPIEPIHEPSPLQTNNWSYESMLEEA